MLFRRVEGRAEAWVGVRGMAMVCRGVSWCVVVWRVACVVVFEERCHCANKGTRLNPEEVVVFDPLQAVAGPFVDV